MVTFVSLESAPRTLEDVLEAKEPISHPFPLGCLPRIKPGQGFLLWCYRFILQYVFVKPMVSVSAVILEFTNLYGDGDWDPKQGYLYLTMIENTSVAIAMYYLVLFYMVTKEDLKPFDPMGKFICIKAVIFFSFWQGVVISGLTYFKLITPEGSWTVDDVGSGLQDFLICLEMFIIAIVHHYVFPYARFRDPNKVPFLYNKKTKRIFSNPSGTFQPVMKNFIQAANVADVIDDTRNTFITPLLSREDRRASRSSSGYSYDSFGSINTSPSVSPTPMDDAKEDSML